MAKHRFSLAWLKPPSARTGGVMTLTDHLRDLRYRVIVAVVAVIVGSIAMSFLTRELYALLLGPYQEAVAILQTTDPALHPTTVINGIVAPFTLMLKVSVVAGIIVSSPIWLWQLWAFIAPALKTKEKKYTLGFLGAAVPLFLMGVVIGYFILPKGISVMLAFTPTSVPIMNLMDVNQFLTLMLQIMIVFGLGFLLPVVVVGLNMVGILPATRLAKVRSYVVFGIFVFAAIASPSTDPLSMLALAIPMVVLYLAAEIIARVHDRKKLREQAEG